MSSPVNSHPNPSPTTDWNLDLKVSSYHQSMAYLIVTLALAVLRRSPFFLFCSAVFYCFSIYYGRSIVNLLIDNAAQKLGTSSASFNLNKLKTKNFPVWTPLLWNFAGKCERSTFGGKSLGDPVRFGICLNPLGTGPDQPEEFLNSLK